MDRESAKRTRVALVTNIPTPYRVPVLNALNQDPAIDLRVIYAARREPGRDWDLPPMEYEHLYLRERVRARHYGQFTHNNPDVFGVLKRQSPDVVITTGFNPTHLYAMGYCVLHRRRHIVMSDGTVASEAGLSKLHKFVRRTVVKGSSAFIVACRSGSELFESYGAKERRTLIAPLCANPLMRWSEAKETQVDFDFLFSGRLIDVKNPFFAVRVAEHAAQRLNRRIRMVFLGEGPLQDELKRAAEKATEVDVTFAGNVTQSAIPAWFAKARLFLFPTLFDPWGVVANEACEAGIPTLVSPNAGAAGDLIVDGLNGRVLPLDEDLWAEAASQLLADASLHARYAAAARERVRNYSSTIAAHRMGEAIKTAVAI